MITQLSNNTIACLRHSVFGFIASTVSYIQSCSGKPTVYFQKDCHATHTLAEAHMKLTVGRSGYYD
jgi:hypothetical protein